LAFLAKNQQLSNAIPMGKQQTPPLKQPIFIQLVRSSTNPIQTANDYNNDSKFESGNTAVGLELMEQLCYKTV